MNKGRDRQEEDGCCQKRKRTSSEFRVQRCSVEDSATSAKSFVMTQVLEEDQRQS